MKIHFIQPWSFDLNIGKAYNEHIELLPSDCWVCITDQDTLKFPGFADRVKQIILSVSKDVIFTSRVNRLRKDIESVVAPLYDCEDIDEHFEMSEFLWNQNKTMLTDAKVIPGCCMVFHRDVWVEIGGFTEQSIRFDTQFSQACKRLGKRLKIAQGLYIFHLYRWDAIEPSKSIDHLIKNN